MVTFEEIIGNLLLRHNCVVIPEFGGFVAKQSSARIDFEKGIVHPPKKSILFNRQLINNDGLMISEFAAAHQISFDEAQLQIREVTRNWMSDLHAGRRIVVDRVGYLFQDEEKNICFEQDRHFNLLMESFGLGQVHFIAQEDVEIVKRKIAVEDATAATVIPVHPELIAEPIVAMEENTTSEVENPFIPVETTKRRSNIWKYAAAVIALPIVFYSVWIPMRTDVLESNMLSFKDFNPFNHKVASKYEAPKNLTTVEKDDFVSLDHQIEAIKDEQSSSFSYSLTEDTYVLVDLGKPATAVSTAPETSSTTQPTEAVTPVANAKSSGMHFIVGCFSEEANANVLIQDLSRKGFSNARILDKKNGLYRVTLGNANSQSELEQYMTKAKSVGLEGWVLK